MPLRGGGKGSHCNVPGCTSPAGPSTHKTTLAGYLGYLGKESFHGIDISKIAKNFPSGSSALCDLAHGGM